jgi:hypothetical protein
MESFSPFFVWQMYHRTAPSLSRSGLLSTKLMYWCSFWTSLQSKLVPGLLITLCWHILWVDSFTIHWPFNNIWKIGTWFRDVCTTITLIPLHQGWDVLCYHSHTPTAQTCLTPGFLACHNIDLNPCCTEHSGTFRAFLLVEARMVHNCIIPTAAQDGLKHQDIHGQGQLLCCFHGHSLVTCYLLHLPPLVHTNLTPSGPSWD